MLLYDKLISTLILKRNDKKCNEFTFKFNMQGGGGRQVKSRGGSHMNFHVASRGVYL